MFLSSCLLRLLDSRPPLPGCIRHFLTSLSTETPLPSNGRHLRSFSIFCCCPALPLCLCHARSRLGTETATTSSSSCRHLRGDCYCSFFPWSAWASSAKHSPHLSNVLIDLLTLQLKSG